MAHNAKVTEGISLLFPTWDAGLSQVTPHPSPPVFRQVSLAVRWYNFMLLGGEREALG